MSDNKQRYTDGVLAAAQRALASGQLRPGMVAHVEIRHDGWCNLLAGKGPCNCSPEVGVVEVLAQPGLK